MAQRKKVVVTGGCGFIGHHFVEHIIKNTDWDIVVFDKLTYAAGGFDRLRDINCFDSNRVRLLTVDFASPISDGIAQETSDVEYIMHLGAETHVDRSIQDAEPFVVSNVLGTMHMLEYARKLKGLKKFVMFSTDEVFGPAPEGVMFKEEDRYNCTNPYAATKAGAEQLAMAYANTHKVPVLVTNTMNVFGERQHTEKFIPMVMRKVLSGEKVSIHADPTHTKSGSRYWIHARNVANAVLFLLDKSTDRDRFNIVGEREVSNLDMALSIARILGKELHYELVDFHSSRPGHDLRYAVDSSKLFNLGYSHPMTFEQTLEKTIRWTEMNNKWLEREFINV